MVKLNGKVDPSLRNCIESPAFEQDLQRACKALYKGNYLEWGLLCKMQTKSELDLNANEEQTKDSKDIATTKDSNLISIQDSWHIHN